MRKTIALLTCVLVPGGAATQERTLKMSELYAVGSTEIRGEASYSKSRQFRTSGRLLTAK